jgi:hypothetical protein
MIFVHNVMNFYRFHADFHFPNKLLNDLFPLGDRGVLS